MPAIKKIKAIKSTQEEDIWKLADQGKLSQLKKLLGKSLVLKNAVRSSDGRTPLHIAAFKSCKEICEYLLSIDVDIIQDKDGNSALHTAAYGIGATLIPTLVDGLKNPAEIINLRNEKKETALEIITTSPLNKEIKQFLIKKLLENGAETIGCLQATIFTQSLSILALFLRHIQTTGRYSEINYPNRLGQTALAVSVATNQPKVALNLITNFKNITCVPDNQGYTPTQSLLSALIDNKKCELNIHSPNFRTKENYALLLKLFEITHDENWDLFFNSIEKLTDILLDNNEISLRTEIINKVKELDQRLGSLNNNADPLPDPLEDIKSVKTDFNTSDTFEKSEIHSKRSKNTQPDGEIFIPLELNKIPATEEQFYYAKLFAYPPKFEIEIEKREQAINFDLLGPAKDCLLNQLMQQDNFFLVGSAATICVLNEYTYYADIDILYIGDINKPPKLEEFTITEINYQYNKICYLHHATGTRQEIRFISNPAPIHLQQTIQRDFHNYGDFTISKFYIALTSNEGKHSVYAPVPSWDDITNRRLRVLKSPNEFIKKDSTWPLRAMSYAMRYQPLTFKVDENIEHIIADADKFLDNCTQTHLLQRRAEKIIALFYLYGEIFQPYLDKVKFISNLVSSNNDNIPSHQLNF